MIKWIKSLYLKIKLHIQYKKRLKEIIEGKKKSKY